MSDFIEKNLPKLLQSIEEATPEKMLGAQPTSPERINSQVPCVLCGTDVAIQPGISPIVLQIGVCLRCASNLDEESRDGLAEVCRRVAFQVWQRMLMVRQETLTSQFKQFNVMLASRNTVIGNQQQDIRRLRAWMKRLAWLCGILMAGIVALEIGR